MGFITRLQKAQETCADMGYDCCNCGDPENGCGCRYCWSCNACEACLNDDDANCRFITTTS